MPQFVANTRDPGECVNCGAPFAAHGPAPAFGCDPDAAAYADLLDGPAVPKRAAATDPPADKPKSRIALLATIAVGVISAGAMASSCVNSGINYRQMRALEKIADHVTTGVCGGNARSANADRAALPNGSAEGAAARSADADRAALPKGSAEVDR